MYMGDGSARGGHLFCKQDTDRFESDILHQMVYNYCGIGYNTSLTQLHRMRVTSLFGTLPRKGQSPSPTFTLCYGDVVEWSIAVLLKSTDSKGSVGSNPTVSAKVQLHRKRVTSKIVLLCPERGSLPPRLLL